MGLQLNTGDTGRKVSAEADGSLYSNIFGNGCFVLSSGNKFKVEIQNNNKIKVYDGDAIIQGRHACIPNSDSDIATINNGSQGKNRKDLIVIHYTKGNNGVEATTIETIQGVETSGNANPPGYVGGDILHGSTAKDFPLYEVELQGINIIAVTPLFETLGTNKNLSDRIDGLNTDLSNTNASLSGISNRPYVLEHGTNVNGSYEKWSDGTLTMHGSGESNDASICTITYPIPFRDSAYSLIAAPQYNLTTVVFALSVQKKDNTSSYVYTRQMNGAALSHVFISWQASGYWR